MRLLSARSGAVNRSIVSLKSLNVSLLLGIEGRVLEGGGRAKRASSIPMSRRETRAERAM